MNLLKQIAKSLQKQNKLFKSYQNYNFCSENAAVSSSSPNLNLAEFLKKLKERQDFSEPKIPVDEYRGLQQMQKQIQSNVQNGSLKEALDISKIYAEKISSFYGITHPAYFSALNNQGLIYKMTGRYIEASEIYEFVFTGYKELYGEQHNSSITILLNIANLDIQQGMYQKALETLQTVLAIRIGQHFMELKGEEPAGGEIDKMKYQNINLEEIESITNVNIPLCLVPMSNCYRELKEFEKSISLLEKALKLLKTKFANENNVFIATVYNNMGLTYKRNKEFEKAEMNYLKALKIRQALFQEGHPDILATQHNLGELYLAMGKQETAEKYLNENVSAMKKFKEANNN